MELPPPWELKESQKFPGRLFYYNKITQESTWIRPIPYPGNPIEWPPTVFVLHILIKHHLSKNAKDLNGAPITRSPDEAKQLVKQIIDEIVIEEKPFEEIALKYSEDEFGPKRGIVGWIKKGDMPKEYQEAAWQLRIGEMSPDVNTEDGIYIILRRG